MCFVTLFSALYHLVILTDIYLWIMVIHIGKKIKEELYKHNISVSDFAKKINRSRNVVYDIFGRKSIDTDLLNKICRVLNYDFFSIYSSQKEFTSENIKCFKENGYEVSSANTSEQNSLRQLQNQAMQNEINYLKKIITLLEIKKEAKARKNKDV